MSTHVGPWVWLVLSVSHWFSIVLAPLSTNSSPLFAASSSSGFPVFSTLSPSSSLCRHSSSILACVLSSSVPCLGRNWHSLLELNFPAIGKPSRVSSWYEFLFLLTTLHGTENFGRSLCSIAKVKSKSLWYTWTKSPALKMTSRGGWVRTCLSNIALRCSACSTICA